MIVYNREMTRFFVKPTEIGSKIITFTPEQSKKIRKVLRMRIGDEVSVFDGNGWEYSVKLTKTTNSFSLGDIVDQKLHEKSQNITVVQALPKNLKIEFILQKCTELGVTRLIFFESEYSQIDATRISKDKVQRWRAICVGACEQSGRVFVPEVILWTEDRDSLIHFCKNQNRSNIFLDFNGKSLKETADLELNDLGIFVGPEGGFSPKERGSFSENGFIPVKISDNILRSETAGMAFLAQLAMLQL